MAEGVCFIHYIGILATASIYSVACFGTSGANYYANIFVFMDQRRDDDDFDLFAIGACKKETAVFFFGGFFQNFTTIPGVVQGMSICNTACCAGFGSDARGRRPVMTKGIAINASTNITGLWRSTGSRVPRVS